jgi:hypothetical protein
VTEEQLTDEELQDRAWAVLAAAAEKRADDIDELLVTLPWDDMVTVVSLTATLCVGYMAGNGVFPPPEGELERTAEQLRALLLKRRAARESSHDDG